MFDVHARIHSFNCLYVSGLLACQCLHCMVTANEFIFAFCITVHFMWMHVAYVYLHMEYMLYECASQLPIGLQYWWCGWLLVCFARIDPHLATLA